MSAPVCVASDVSDTGNRCALICVRIYLSRCYGSHCRTLSFAISVAVKAFLEQWHQIYEMVGET